MALDQEEFKFPDEVDSENNANEIKVELEDDNTEVAIEIVDDTPEQDRDRKPLPKEMVEELEKDEAEEYSQRVKERMAQLKKVWHDERREKEAAAREREEAVKYAQRLMEENKRLKSTLTSGEKSYVEVAKQAVEHEMELATRTYREAYDLGDTDKIIEAQKRMNDAQYKLAQIQNYRPQYENALQEEQNRVNIQPESIQAPKLSEKDRSWQEKNDWFGTNRRMTSFALGVHEDLVEEGFRPGSDEYYRRVDNEVQKRFPEYFGATTTLDEEQPAQRTKPSTVVAPATRSTAPKKVQISKSAQTLAKKLGISPEQYAKELVKLENK